MQVLLALKFLVKINIGKSSMFGFFKKIFGGGGEEAPKEKVLAEKAPKAEEKSDEKPLFEKLGGEAAVDAAVDLFYRKVLADDDLAPFFETIDMAEQHVKQKAFLTMAFGGPNNYTGKDMTKAHARLVKMGMNEKHFDLVMKYLGETLTELKVPGELIEQAAGIAMSVKEDVLKGE